MSGNSGNSTGVFRHNPISPFGGAFATARAAATLPFVSTHEISGELVASAAALIGSIEKVAVLTAVLQASGADLTALLSTIFVQVSETGAFTVAGVQDGEARSAGVTVGVLSAAGVQDGILDVSTTVTG